MKRKIKIIDNVNKVVVQTEVVIPNKAHLESQIKYPARVFRDKTKYRRKEKHHKSYMDD